MIKIFMVLVAVITVMLMGAGCLAPTKSTTTIYRGDGTIEKVVESSESVVKTITDSTKNKTCATWDNGWLGGISYVPPGSDAENPMGALKMLAGKNDRGVVTFSDKHDAKYLPQVIEAARAGEINVGATGISNSTGSASTDTETATGTANAALADKVTTSTVVVDGVTQVVTPETVNSTVITDTGNTVVINPAVSGGGEGK